MIGQNSIGVPVMRSFDIAQHKVALGVVKGQKSQDLVQLLRLNDCLDNCRFYIEPTRIKAPGLLTSSL